MSIDARRAGVGDAALLVELVATRKGARIDLAYARTLLSDPRVVLVLADAEGRPAGFAYCHVLPRIDRPQGQLFVYEVDVDPAYRRRGVGRALMQFVARLVREQGLAEGFVIADADNEAASALYRGIGAAEAPTLSRLFVYLAGANE